MHPIIIALLSYLLGSIPTAYIFARLLKGVDIRTVGSGNVGATNASRILGKKIGFLVLLLDVLKGLIAVTLLTDIGFRSSDLNPEQQAFLRIIFGIACISGHNWTLFLQFKGGKGVATTLGVLIGLAISIPGLRVMLGLLLLTWVIVFAVSRIISLASISAAVALPLLLIISKQSFLLISSGSFLSVLVIIRHIPNIKRLINGTEPHFTSKKK